MAHMKWLGIAFAFLLIVFSASTPMLSYAQGTSSSADTSTNGSTGLWGDKAARTEDLLTGGTGGTTGTSGSGSTSTGGTATGSTNGGTGTSSTGGSSNGFPTRPATNATGLRVIFTSLSNGNDGNIYQIDRPSNARTLISVNPSGQPGNGGSDYAHLSANGRYAVFSSTATDLVTPPLVKKQRHVYMRDLAKGKTVLVSTGVQGVGNGDSIFSSVSDDGRYVAFTTSATNLIASTSNASKVLVKDLKTGALVAANVRDGDGGADTGGVGGEVRISADGRYVAFTSRGQLVPADTNVTQDVYRRDLQEGRTVCLSVPYTGKASGAKNAKSILADMSGDGSRIVFHSNVKITKDDLNGSIDDAYLATIAGQTFQIRRFGYGGAKGYQYTSDGSLSRDGRFLGFKTNARLLPLAHAHGEGDLYMIDLNSDALYCTTDEIQDGGWGWPLIANGGGTMVFCNNSLLLAQNPGAVLGTVRAGTPVLTATSASDARLDVTVGVRGFGKGTLPLGFFGGNEDVSWPLLNLNSGLETPVKLSTYVTTDTGFSLTAAIGQKGVHTANLDMVFRPFNPKQDGWNFVADGTPLAETPDFKGNALGMAVLANRSFQDGSGIDHTKKPSAALKAQLQSEQIAAGKLAVQKDKPRATKYGTTAKANNLELPKILADLKAGVPSTVLATPGLWGLGGSGMVVNASFAIADYYDPDPAFNGGSATWISLYDPFTPNAYVGARYWKAANAKEYALTFPGIGCLLRYSGG
ncbi:hypothetical protein BH11ARM2_BH11ARM2_00430 [soil metagenome]